MLIFYSVHSAKDSLKLFHLDATSDINYIKFNHSWKLEAFRKHLVNYKTCYVLGIQRSIPHEGFIL